MAWNGLKTLIKGAAGFRIPIAAMVMGAFMAMPGEAQIRVLVFRAFFGYEHSALLTATQAIKNTLPTLLGPEPAFLVDTAIALSKLNSANLAQYQVLVLNNNTGIGGLDSAQRAAVMDFARTKGIVAIMGTLDNKGGAKWPEMEAFLGTTQQAWNAGLAKLRTEAVDHPVNAGLAAEVRMNDLWARYSSNPRDTPGTTVLTNIDESSMKWNIETMGDHPLSWCKENGTGGRMFYTGMGHRDSVMERNPYARRQLYNAILWAAKASPVSITSRTSAAAGSDLRTAADEGVLRVAFWEGGEHSFTVAAMDGRRLAMRRGTGPRDYAVPGLRPGAVYVVAARSSAGSFSKLVFIP